MFDPEFIQRVNSKEFQDSIRDDIVESEYKRNKWKIENPQAYRDAQKKYSKTEKGKIACRRRNCISNMRVREMSKQLNDQELEAIRLFYVNCPKGCHVDHIIPLSKGGKHHISNLQYLTPKENMTKGRKVLFIEIQECPECDNPMRSLSEETRYCDDCKKAFDPYYRTEGIKREHLLKGQRFPQCKPALHDQP